MAIQTLPSPLRLLPSVGGDPLTRALLKLLSKPLELALRFPALNRIYAQCDVDLSNPDRFVDSALRALGVRFSIAHAEQLERFPRSGPVILVANHPFGVVEGMIVAQILRRIRPDVKIMANHLLRRVREMERLLIYVDPFGTDKSARSNYGPLRETVRWLRDGGVLAMFPAGQVSHLYVHRRAVIDPPWSATVGRLVQRTGASVVPVFFAGRNGALFQLAGLVHPLLRTLMLPSELINKRKREISLCIGGVIPPSTLKTFESPEDLTSYLRVRTYLLGAVQQENATQPEGTERLPTSLSRRQPTLAPIAAAGDPAEIAAEVARLPESACVVDAREFAVYVARGNTLQAVLREIGRLREVTFRRATEGTGKPLDLSSFDDYYLHLWVWNKRKQEIVGAYRLGLMDEILERHGVSGLYTSQLFRFKRGLLDRIHPAIELGRSFVREEYQKSYSSLMLLWKGIGHFLVRNPRYRYMFGPVSINSEYLSISQHMIMAFLKSHTHLPDLARFIKPRRPPRRRPPAQWEPRLASRVLTDIEDVSTLVSEIETDQKGVPVLLRQYLKLGAKLLAFNVDPEFGYVLDGLMLVDLAHTDRRVLEYYMGREGLATFRAHHGLAN
jgi:putative hemolysin